MNRFEQIIAGCLFCGSLPLFSQIVVPEAPRHLSGSLALGYLDSRSKEFFVDEIRNPFTSVRFDYQSYFLDPDFLSYRIQPRFASGFQDIFSGISDGTGVAAEADFLRRRYWPLQFKYSFLRRQILTSSQTGSYSRFVSNSDDSIIGVRWQYLVPNQPHFDVAFNDINTLNSPENFLYSGYRTHSKTLALNGNYNRWGWSLNGSASLQDLDTQYIQGREQSTVLFPSNNRLKNYWITGQRPLQEKMTVSISANRTDSRSEYDTTTYDQEFDTVQAKFEYSDKDSWQVWGVGRQTHSNIEMSRQPRDTGPNYTIPPTQVLNRIADSEIRYRVYHGLRLLGRFQFTNVVSPDLNQIQRTGNFANTGGGFQYAASRKSLSLNLTYYLFNTTSDFDVQAATNRFSQAADISVSAGDPNLIRVGASGSLSKARENVRTFLPFYSDNRRVRFTLGHTFFHRHNLELVGGYTRMEYERTEVRSEYLSRDYGVTLNGPRYFLSYYRGTGSGNSFQPILAVPVPGLPPDIPIPPVMLVVGSSNTMTTYATSWNPLGRLQLRGLWRTQDQKLAGIYTSQFEQQEATLAYPFRRLRFEAGYLIYKYNFGSPIYRKSLVFRVSRDFQLF
ncbi:MAG: hypothetical protein HY821_08485 [Acidobacteria bacterium]|nr:hypothetical protein [Acidobacteriota bacterium]